MALNTYTLVAISFAVGAATAVIATEFFGHSDGDVSAGLARVEATATNPEPREPVDSVSTLRPSDSPSPLAYAGAAATPDPIAGTPSVSECADADQRDRDADQATVNFVALDALDPTLRDEWDTSATAYEREEERLFQEDILAMEEEANLYSAPPSDYEMSDEEQAALERDRVADSVAALTTVDEFFQQQILDNEAAIEAVFGDQGETWEYEEE